MSHIKISEVYWQRDVEARRRISDNWALLTARYLREGGSSCASILNGVAVFWGQRLVQP